MQDYLPVNTNGRRLKPNHGNATPSNLLFVDTETNENPHPDKPSVKLLTLRLWCAEHVTFRPGRQPVCRPVQGYSPESFWDLVKEVSRPKHPLWVFAHNLVFDLTTIQFWELLDKGEFTIGPVPGNGADPRVRGKRPFNGYLVLENKPTFATLMGPIGKVHFVDTLNYFQCSLRELGRSYGVPKWDMPDPAETDDAWFDYCQNDVKVIREAMCSLIGEWRKGKCGVWAKTAASLAMNSYRHIEVTNQYKRNAPVISVARDTDCEDVERSSYTGSRIEPFYMGKMTGPIYHLDVNSLYPYVMRNCLFPTRRLGHLKNISVDRLASEMMKHCVTAVVEIDSECDTYPLRIDGRIWRPVGNYITTLATPELRHALEHGNIKRVHSCIVYECSPVFREWVDYWYSVKVKASELGEEGIARRNVAKMILNSLSGKWAQIGKKWKSIPGGKCRLRWGGWTERDCDKDITIECRGIAGIRQERYAADPPRHYFPAISAHITSAGREYMREIMNLCPPRSILYTATDSLICTADAYNQLMQLGQCDPKTLGKLALKGIHTEAEICGPNWYRLDESWIRSGNHGRGRPDASGRWYYEAWSTATDIVARKPDGSIRVVAIPLSATHPRCLGSIGKDGWVAAKRIEQPPPF